MRTTIRLGNEKRETLVSLAQERGEKGVSRVVEEAVAFYLRERNRPAPLVVPTPIIVEAAPPPPPAPPGRFERWGAFIDREMNGQAGAPGVVALLRGLVKGGLSRLPLLRA